MRSLPRNLGPGTLYCCVTYCTHVSKRETVPVNSSSVNIQQVWPSGGVVRRICGKGLRRHIVLANGAHGSSDTRPAGSFRLLDFTEVWRNSAW